MKLGVLGAGQLARMLALAAYPLGIQTVCLDPNPTACAKDVTRVITGELTDQSLLKELMSQVDVITYETENIPLESAKFIVKNSSLQPNIRALETSQDRYLEKTFFQALQIPTLLFKAVSNRTELIQAIEEIGLPCAIKTRKMGYDGKGQYILRCFDDVEPALKTLISQDLILEKFINYDNELSLIAVRNKTGDINFYPMVFNHHQDGILRFSEAPFIDLSLQQQAQQYMQAIMIQLNYTGILTLEFFNVGKKLIANEMAPRVHNSGHWTIEGALTSQFENHLRALFNLPLGKTDVLGQCALFNCIGSLPALDSVLSYPGVHAHQYGKIEKPNRKLGHITLIDNDPFRYESTRNDLVRIIK